MYIFQENEIIITILNFGCNECKEHTKFNNGVLVIIKLETLYHNKNKTSKCYKLLNGYSYGGSSTVWYIKNMKLNN